MFNTLPTRFRHYEVLKLLGGGGFGLVYLARDRNLKRLVVLKTLHPHLAAQPEMVRRFVQEARAMARLDHNNIVRVYRVDASRDPQKPFFEMEYVEGQTLKGYRGARVLSLQEAMPILKQIAAALDAAHRQKMVHRDVKPDNVLIKADGQLKLTDFGIIKLLEVTGTALASTGGIIGTPSYMAPEQADLSRKHEIGPATDIYALGVMTYQLLTGRLPFEGHPHSVLAAHATQAPPDPLHFNRYLPAPVAQVLLNVLAKQPANRYPTAMSFVERLEQPGSIESKSVIPQGPMLIGLGLIIVMACIIGLLVRPFIDPTDPPVVLATETPAGPTQAPAEPTEVPPTATPALGIGSTMVAQDGMTLLYVPQGEFLRGSKKDEPNAEDREQPQRSIYLDAFWIDQTEVTNEMFAAFLNQHGNQKEGGTTWVEIEDEDALISESGGAFQPKEGFANHPVIEVSWYGAKAYCEWAGRRLPTEAEWEKAARGTEGDTYPWGKEDVAGNLVNLCDKNCEFSGIHSIDDGYATTAPVGSYPDGASPYGALDMAGNVWEWTADWYDAKYYKDAPERNPQGPDTSDSRVLRGGSWNNIAPRTVRAGNRTVVEPANRNASYGVRCARSP